MTFPRALLTTTLLAAAGTKTVTAQAPGRWPPDSLINTQVIARTTPVIEVVGMMRNVAVGLGVRCEYCHVGRADLPLEQFDFASDQKRNKLVARQMMRMVQEINRRLDTIPERPASAVQVSCSTCHRGVERPAPLSQVLVDIAQAAGTDSVVRAYRALRDAYFGGDSYDFRESSLTIAAFRLGRARKFAEAFALLDLNEQLYPGSSGMSVFRGNISLMRGDTTAAEAAYREAVRRDPANTEARGRLRNIGKSP